MEFIVKSVVYGTLMTIVTSCHTSRHSENLQLNASRDLTYLSNPGFPTTYYASNNCNWELHGPNNSFSIFIDVLEYHIERSAGCRYDFLRLFDGPSVFDPLLLSACASNTVGSVYSTTGQDALVNLKSDSSVQLQGFELRYLAYEKVSPYGCSSGITTSPSELLYIQSPGFPNLASQNSDCTWTITPSSLSSYFIISLVYMDLPESDSCTESVKIYDGPSTADKLLETWCYSRSTFPTNAVALNSATGQQVFVELKIDAVGTARAGFIISFNETETGIVPSPPVTEAPLPTYSICSGGTISVTSSPQLLTSPSYPIFYSGYLDCSITLVAPDGQQIYLTVEDFSIEDSGECKSDKVTIYDGSSSSYIQLGRFCAADAADVNSTGRYMHLTFVSDGSIADRGFEFRFISSSQETPNCVDEFSNITQLAANKTVQYFESPSFPDRYADNNEIVWLIHNPTDQGYIKVAVEESRVEASYQCVYDAVTVYKGPCTSYPVLGSFCSHETPVYYNDAGSYVMVVFQSDASVHFKGFKMSYVVVDDIPDDDDSKVLRITAIVLGSLFGVIVLGIIVAAVVIAIRKYRQMLKKIREGEREAALLSPGYLSAKRLLSLTVTIREKLPKTRVPKKKVLKNDVV